MTDKETIRELLQKALDAAQTAGMEAAAEAEGCTWTGRSLEAVDAEAEEARKVLEEALGLGTKGAINYVYGDATRPQGEGPKFLIHVVNDLGLWGAGFVMAVSRRWSAPEHCYYDWGGPYELGQVQLVKVEEDLYVLNMIGQHGVGNYGVEPPIRYEAIRKCLQQVEAYARSETFRGPFKVCSVHAPRFGAGLAGGDWNVIEQIINEELVEKGIPVTVYDYNG